MTGSLVNEMYGQARQPDPEVGMGCTVLMWTDRLAGTIVAVPNRRTVHMQCDEVYRTDSHGMSDAQSYRYERNPNAQVRVYTLRKNGAWVRQGGKMRGGERLAIGMRQQYYDYSF